jgi:hypothetical protein
VIDPQPAATDESATSAGQSEPASAASAAAPAPLVLLAGDDALVCVDELCLPAEATR